MTELEYCVLGTVWRSGPVTAYEIARPFADSPSAYWSGSAGAIYPLVRRLEEKGLLRGEKTEWSSRQKRVFTLTDEGLKELRHWLSPPFPESAGAASFDPVRTRLVFLNALPRGARARFLEDAERVVRMQLQRLEELYASEREEGKRFDALATRGGIHELRARLRWLGEIRKDLLG